MHSFYWMEIRNKGNTVPPEPAEMAGVLQNPFRETPNGIVIYLSGTAEMQQSSYLLLITKGTVHVL